MASITKRGNYWRAQVRAHGQESISRTFNTKSAAQAWSKDIESQIGRGEYRPLGEAQRTTLHKALDRYYSEVASRRRHPDRELQRVNHWKRQALTKRYLTDLRGVDFARYRDSRRADGRAEATIRLELQFVTHLFEIARKEWGMEGLLNPLKNIRKPACGIERERRLLHGEFEALRRELSASGNAWAVAAFELSIETTLRQGMLFNLRREWLSNDGQVFHIPPQFRSTGNKNVPVFVPLSKRAQTIVADLPRPIDGSLFGCTQNAVVLVWKKALKKARERHEIEMIQRGARSCEGYLKDLRWHDLRHEGVSRLFEKGLHPLEVASISGHKNLTMLRRYTHLQPAQLLAKLG